MNSKNATSMKKVSVISTREPRDKRRQPVHQERLGGNFDAGALRQDHAAAVNDREDGDRLARFALGVKGIAAEVHEVERDADDEQDRNGVPWFREIAEPSRWLYRTRGANSDCRSVGR